MLNTEQEKLIQENWKEYEEWIDETLAEQDATQEQPEDFSF